MVPTVYGTRVSASFGFGQCWPSWSLGSAVVSECIHPQLNPWIAMGKNYDPAPNWNYASDHRWLLKGIGTIPSVTRFFDFKFSIERLLLVLGTYMYTYQMFLRTISFIFVFSLSYLKEGKPPHRGEDLTQWCSLHRISQLSNLYSPGTVFKGTVQPTLMGVKLCIAR